MAGYITAACCMCVCICLTLVCQHQYNTDTLDGVPSKMTRYVYNCLLHLCGKHGRVYDGLDLLAAMRADGGVLEDCTPDGYTYRCVCVCVCAFVLCV
jgi:pentatricopeptide repeat protein